LRNIDKQDYRKKPLPQKPLPQQAGSPPQRVLAGILEKTGARRRILRGIRRETGADARNPEEITQKLYILQRRRIAKVGVAAASRRRQMAFETLIRPENPAL